MPNNGNATWMKIVITVLLTGLTVAVGYGVLQHEVADNTEFRKDDGAKNTEHRIRFEEKVTGIQDDVAAIRKIVENER